jgi:hypothetical protein
VGVLSEVVGLEEKQKTPHRVVMVLTDVQLAALSSLSLV